MSNLENARSPAPVPPPARRTWDFMETAFATLIAYGVFTLTSGLALIVIVTMHHGASLSTTQLEALAMQGRWYGAALIIASPLTIGTLWIAIRMARREFSEYLALNWPSLGELVRALPVVVIYLVAGIVIDASGVEEHSIDQLLSVRGPGGLLILLVGGCIAAPILEEFVVRGFMFRGW
jgi:membrane protease YdiL (CAAX protease family)